MNQYDPNYGHAQFYKPNLEKKPIYIRITEVSRISVPSCSLLLPHCTNKQNINGQTNEAVDGQIPVRFD
jgi:hypothetical protein